MTNDFARVRNGILEEKGYDILDAEEYDEMVSEMGSEKMEWGLMGENKGVVGVF